MKRFRQGLILLALVLSLGGCSSQKAADEALTAAVQNAQEMANYQAQMHLDFVFGGGGQTQEAQVDTKLLQWYEPVCQEIAITTEAGGQQIGGSHFYVGEENGVMMIYMQYDGQWYKSQVDEATIYSLLGHYDMRAILPILLQAASTARQEGEEVLANGRKTEKITAMNSEEKLPETLLSTGTFVSAGLSDAVTAEDMVGCGDMEITFWLDEAGRVVQYCYDAADAYQAIADHAYASVQGQEGYEQAQRIEVEQYEITVTMDEVDTAPAVDIPQEALDGILLEESETQTSVMEEAVGE